MQAMQQAILQLGNLDCLLSPKLDLAEIMLSIEGLPYWCCVLLCKNGTRLVLA